MERGLSQWQEALPRDPRERLPKQRRDLRPLHGPAQACRGPGQAALVRAPREEERPRGAVSHLEERGGVVHAQGGEVEQGAEGVSEEAVRGRRGARRRLEVDPRVQRHGQEPRRREARRVARRGRGVQGSRDAALRRGAQEGPRRGEGRADGNLEQRAGGGVRPQAQAAQEAGLRAGWVRPAEGEDAGWLTAAWAAVLEGTHRFTKRATEPTFNGEVCRGRHHSCRYRSLLPYPRPHRSYAQALC